MFRRKKHKRTTRIYDTVRCYNAAYDAAQVHKTEEPVIVHGIIDKSGDYIVYAWCEIGESVYDYTLDKNPIPREEYYEQNGVVENGVIRYTIDEYKKLLLKISGFGPFDMQFFNAVIQELKSGA
jgi:hypothetical protein